MLWRVIRSRLQRERLLVAGGIGTIVGVGMALFALIFDQSWLWLGLGAGIDAALLMLFPD
jgi:hypothetical protein